MTGDGKGKKKGTDIFYVFHNGKPLNSGFGDLIEKWSLPWAFHSRWEYLSLDSDAEWQPSMYMGNSENKSYNIIFIWFL